MKIKEKKRMIKKVDDKIKKEENKKNEKIIII
jgi:hypothetical protein